MLFLLTGNIQVGKTRWLEAQAASLARGGTPVAGVLAPGVWRRCEPGDPAADAHGFEKAGIDNVLLPDGERVHLARRRDLAVFDGSLERGGQSERAGLGWDMSDAAIARVDAHFRWLAEDPAHGRGGAPVQAGGLVVVDELGRLELMRGEGLASALALLALGPRAGWPHALAVVRGDLLPYAHAALDAAWAGAVREISPVGSLRELLV